MPERNIAQEVLVARDREEWNRNLSIFTLGMAMMGGASVVILEHFSGPNALATDVVCGAYGGGSLMASAKYALQSISSGQRAAALEAVQLTQELQQPEQLQFTELALA